MAVFNGTNNPDTITGGGGNDTIIGGDKSDILRGGAGNDQIFHYLQNYSDDLDADQLFGEEGNDFLQLGKGDIGDGGAGNDTLEVRSSGVAGLTGGGGMDTLRVFESDDIAGATISGIERLEAIASGASGSQMTVAQLASFATIGAIGGGSSVAIGLTGAGAATLTFEAPVTFANLIGSKADETITLAAGSTAAVDYEGQLSNGTVTLTTRVGNDTLEGGDKSDVLRAGAGDDQLFHYLQNYSDDLDVDQLFGEEGNDFLRLGKGDIGDGGTGNDTLEVRGTGVASLAGGSNTDTLRVAEKSDITGATISGIERLEAAASGAVGSQMTVAQLTNFATIGAIGGGSSVVIGLTGAGAATLTFEVPVTFANLIGSKADETITLAAGSTAAVDYEGQLSNGTVTLTTRVGNDTLEGGDKSDVLRAGAGDDLLYHYLTANSDDNDVDQLFGEDGNDYLKLGNGDTGDGGSGNDTLESFGASTLVGGTNDDLMIGSTANERFDGGAGTDTVSYERSGAPVTVSLAVTTAQATGGGGTDTVLTLENLIGGRGSDSLTGSSGANVITGLAGDDTISGGGGSDTARYAGAESAVTVDLRITAAQNTLGGGTDRLSSMENLIGSSFNDTLTGTDADNVIDGGLGNDLIDGNGGIDTLDYASATAGVTVSLAIATAQVTKGAGTDTISDMENLSGSQFSDRLTGSSSANLLTGGSGNNSLIAGAGNDTLVGGTGADQLTGEAGADIFDFNSSSESTLTGRDTILDFEGAGAASGDRIDLAGIDADTTVSGNGTFVFNSAAKGGIRLIDEGATTVLLGNTDDDDEAEFSIVLADGATGAAVYTAQDFAL